jgi:hypothetical protein
MGNVFPSVAEIMGHPEEGVVTLIIDPDDNDTDSESQPSQPSLPNRLSSYESIESLDIWLLNESSEGLINQGLELLSDSSEAIHQGLGEVYKILGGSNETTDESSLASNLENSPILARKFSNTVRFSEDNIMNHVDYKDESVKSILFYNAHDVATFHSDFMEEMMRANSAGMTWKEWVNSRTDTDWDYEMRKYRLRNLDKEIFRLPSSSRRREDQSEPKIASANVSERMYNSLSNSGPAKSSQERVGPSLGDFNRKSAFASGGGNVLKQKLIEKRRRLLDIMEEHVVC